MIGAVSAPIIFGKMCFLLISEDEFFHEIKCNGKTSFMEFMGGCVMVVTCASQRDPRDYFTTFLSLSDETTILLSATNTVNTTTAEFVLSGTNNVELRGIQKGSV